MLQRKLATKVSAAEYPLRPHNPGAQTKSPDIAVGAFCNRLAG